MSVLVTVSGFSGHWCDVKARRSWTVQELKWAVEYATGVSSIVQRLVFGTREPQNVERLETLAAESADELSVTLVCRSQLQAEWLQKVSECRLQPPWSDSPDSDLFNNHALTDLLSGAPPEILADREVLLAALDRQCYKVLDLAAPELRGDREFVLSVVKHPRVLEYSGGDFLADREVVLAALQSGSLIDLRDWASDREVLLASVRAYGGHTHAFHAAPGLWKDREFVRSAVERDARALKDAEREIQTDRDVLIAAVREACYGEVALQFATPEMWTDQEFVLAVVERDARALQDVHPEIRADREVVLAAAREQDHGKHALECATPDMMANREFVLAVAGMQGKALMSAAPELWADREVVLTAIKSNPCNHELVLAAVMHNPVNLMFADPELQADQDVLHAACDATLAAVREGCGLEPKRERKRMPRVLRSEHQIIVDAVAQDPVHLRTVAQKLRADHNAWVVNGHRNLKLVEEKLKAIEASLSSLSPSVRPP
mmetsp:Transcript_108744/g.318148  ORF Transcript_108744/g.318148 Transcript_108744/m.318148 type:complete len:492 (+) Transcript_108744:116-1591(+)